MFVCLYRRTLFGDEPEAPLRVQPGLGYHQSGTSRAAERDVVPPNPVRRRSEGYLHVQPGMEYHQSGTSRAAERGSALPGQTEPYVVVAITGGFETATRHTAIPRVIVPRPAANNTEGAA